MQRKVEICACCNEIAEHKPPADKSKDRSGEDDPKSHMIHGKRKLYKGIPG